MNRYVLARDWLVGLDLRAYAGLLALALCVVAAAVFGILPHGGLKFINALLSGVVWMICLGVVIFGGKRVDAVNYGAAALIAGGLTTTIPSIFYDHTPVDWGIALSGLGFCVLVVRWAHDLYARYQDEKAKEG